MHVVGHDVALGHEPHAAGSPLAVHGSARCSACTLSLRCASSAHVRGHSASLAFGHIMHWFGSKLEFLRSYPMIAALMQRSVLAPAAAHCGANSFQTKSTVFLKALQNPALSTTGALATAPEPGSVQGSFAVPCQRVKRATTFTSVSLLRRNAGGNVLTSNLRCVLSIRNFSESQQPSITPAPCGQQFPLASPAPYGGGVEHRRFAVGSLLPIVLHCIGVVPSHDGR